MANELVRFTLGQKDRLSSEPIEAGKVLFAIDGDGVGGTLYLDKDSSSRIPISSYWKDITPLKSKEYTNVIAEAKSDANATFNFIEVYPNSYNDFWSITYVIRSKIQNKITGQAQALVHLDGQRNSIISYYIYNNIMDTNCRPYYYHTSRLPNQTGFENNCPAYIGIDLYYNASQSYEIINKNYQRDFHIDIIEAFNCEANFLDEMTLWGTLALLDNHDSTNYPTKDDHRDGVTQGITITGDRNSNNYDRLVLYNNNLLAGEHGIKQYSLIMRDITGAWQSFTTTQGTDTVKPKNTIGFILDKIYYYYNANETLANDRTPQASIYNTLTNTLVDLRYSTNCGQTLEADREVYIVGTLGSDGLFYLDDTWWTQTKPTRKDGKLYLLIGFSYDNYRIDFNGFDRNQIWYHDGTNFIPFIQSEFAEKDSEGNIFQSSYGADLNFNNGTLTLKSPDGTVLKSVTLPDTKYEAGTGLILDPVSHIFSANLYSGSLKSSNSVSDPTTAANRQYPIEISNNGYLSVNVPWTDTTYTADSKGITLSNKQFQLSLKDKTNKFTSAAGDISTASNRVYPVGLDSNNKLAVSIPWSDTKYEAGTGLTLSSTTFYNDGILSLATGTSNGTIKYTDRNHTGNQAVEVAVAGLKDLAYIGKPTNPGTSKYLREDGTWVTPTTYSVQRGLTTAPNTNNVFEPNLKSYTLSSLASVDLPASNVTRITGRQYPIELDSNEKLSVYVPWIQYSASGNGISLNSNNVFSLALKSNTKSSLTVPDNYSSTVNREYAVHLDKNGYLAVNVPWTDEDTEYFAADGLTLSGQTFYNDGILTLDTGTTNGTFSYTTRSSANPVEVAIVGLKDLAYIETDGNDSVKFLKGDGTWAIPENTTYTADYGITTESTSNGRTFIPDLIHYSTSSLSVSTPTGTRTSGRQYPVELSSNRKLSVYVPWTDTNTTYKGRNGVKGPTTVSGVNYFEANLKTTTQADYDSTTISNVNGRQYAVVLDKSGYLSVNVPWDTQINYSAKTGLTLSGTAFYNDGVLGIKEGTTAGAIVYTIRDGATETQDLTVPVHGLGNLAYISKPQTAGTSKYLREDGTWVVPPNTEYTAIGGVSIPTGTHEIQLDLKTLTASPQNIQALPTTRIANRQYALEISNDGYLSTYIPWIQYGVVNNSGISLNSSNQFSLNLKSYTKSSLTAPDYESTSGKEYAVHLDKNGNLAVNVPWINENTTYTAGDGLTLSGQKFYNDGILSLATGTNNGTIKYTVRGTGATNPIEAEVAVAGLGTLAYINKDGNNSTKFLKGDGTWAVPTNTTYKGRYGIDGPTTVSGVNYFGLSLKSYEESPLSSVALPAQNVTRTTGRQYPVELDFDDKLSVYVPWTDNNTVYSGRKGVKGPVAENGVNYFEADLAATKSSLASREATSTSGKQYPVQLDSNDKLSVNVNWTDTTYSAKSNGGITMSANREFSLTNSAVTIAGNSVSLGGSLSAATLRSSLGLSSALRYIGKATNTISDGGTQDPGITGYSTKTAGDVILDSNSSMEYVWTGSAWERLGSETSFKTLQMPITSPTASGNSTSFIDTISQTENGEISATKKTIPTATASVIGITNLSETTTNTLLSELSTSTSTLTDDTYFIRQEGTSTFKQIKLSTLWSYVKGKADSVYATPANITAAINNLDATVTGSAGNGKYVSKVEQVNGVVNIVYSDFSPSISITNGDASNAPKVNVTVNTKSGTAQALNKATTSAYGVTKLSSTASTSEEGLAATPKGVSVAINEVKYKVTQEPKSNNAEYPIIVKRTNNTTTETDYVNYNGNTADSNIHQTTINPSTGTISAGSYKVAQKVQLQYDSDTESLNFVFI